MLTVSQISIALGGRTLFEDASFQLNRGDRIALVGANGAGKSTLFSILLRQRDPDTGTLAVDRGVKVGYLPQESAPAGDETVIELAVAVTPELAELRRELTACEKAGEISSERYHAAQGAYAEAGGFGLDPIAKRILHGLAFRESDFERPAKELSGGWIMRAHLARLLVMEPDLLLLDEPTNHLDLESLGWFQGHLQTYPGAILMISHDRAFLNSIVDSILEIRQSKLHRYKGDYDDYVRERQAREERQLAAYKNQQKEIEALQRFADRFRAKASKASQAQSKLRQIDRMEKIEAPVSSEKTVSIRFPQPPRGGQRSITLEAIHHAYGEHVVYRGVDFESERGDRTVLVGPNGAGKSTLLKLLAGVLSVQQGKRLLGHNVKTGYYSQNRVEMLEPKRTVLDEVMSIERPVSELVARTVLGSFLFSGEDAFKRVGVLSGGEKSRLALVKLLLDPPNVLLMDEPTTHLDIASIDALIVALDQFEGTLIFISHDVHFIRSLAKQVLHIHAGKLTRYAGDYDYYLDKTQATSERAGLVASNSMRDERPLDAPRQPSASPKPAFKTKEQKRLEAEQRQAKARARKQTQEQLSRIESETTAMEAKQKEKAAQLEDPVFYQSGGDVVRLNRDLIEIQTHLARLASEWEKVATQLETTEKESPSDT